jgi:hypothetical protein
MANIYIGITTNHFYLGAHTLFQKIKKKLINSK